MNKDTKLFMFALDQSSNLGGMVWYGELPSQVLELFDIKRSESNPQYTILGVLVKTEPQYLPQDKNQLKLRNRVQ